MMGKIAGLVSALLVTIGVVSALSVHIASATSGGFGSGGFGSGGFGSGGFGSAADGSAQPHAASAAPRTGPPTTTKTYSMKVAGMTRSWVVVAPAKSLPKTAPIMVMLSGIGATVPMEMARDQLTPYAAADKAEVVYPVAFQGSWNAIGCCGMAGKDNVADLAFLNALVSKLDPGRTRRIDVIGYSNGARLAYRVACTSPKLFDAYAMVKGGPMPRCAVSKPVDIEQLASMDDPEVPYQPGGKGSESLSALAIVARLRAADKCPVKSVTSRTGNLVLNNWNSCATGKRVALAVWKSGKHSFPRPPVSDPGAAPVVYAFFTKTRLAPLP
jgi:polyhydroxybutyrate depolymerase